jgi:hypothetical protein
MRPQHSIWLGTVTLTIAALVWCSHSAMAAETAAIDPTGTWKIVMINPETKAKGSEHTLKLRLEDGKLTGTIDGRSSINGKVKVFEWPIKDTKLERTKISFTVTHAPVAGRGPDSTTDYDGKITGDTMKGTSELEFNGLTIKRDFEAKRVKE